MERTFSQPDRRLRRRLAGLLALGAVVLLAVVAAGSAAATDPYVGGSDVTRVLELPPGRATAVLGWAIDHEGLLGLRGAARRTVERIEDRRGHATYDEVTDLDAGGRPTAILRYAPDGRLVGATRLGWARGPGSSLPSASEAVRAALAFARSAGTQPSGSATARRRGSDGWSVGWGRSVGGVPVPGDGIRVQLWDDGSFHGFTATEHALATRPSRPIDSDTAIVAVRSLLDRWIPAGHRAEAVVDSASLAWVAPNDTFEPTRPDAPADVLRLAWVVRVRSVGDLAGVVRALEVSIDAGDGSLLGGDVLR